MASGKRFESYGILSFSATMWIEIMMKYKFIEEGIYYSESLSWYIFRPLLVGAADLACNFDCKELEPGCCCLVEGLLFWLNFAFLALFLAISSSHCFLNIVYSLIVAWASWTELCSPSWTFTPSIWAVRFFKLGVFPPKAARKWGYWEVSRIILCGWSRKRTLRSCFMECPTRIRPFSISATSFWTTLKSSPEKYTTMHFSIFLARNILYHF